MLGSKLGAFSYAAMVAGLGGILTTLYYPSALFSGYDTLTSITLVSNSVIGGVGFAVGPVVGGAGQNGGLGYQLLNTIDSGWVTYLSLIFGVMTLLVIIQAPDGLVPLQARDLRRLASALTGGRARRREPDHPLVEPTEIERREATHRLAVSGVTVQFGGVTALSEVGFELHSGEVLGIIGPNGAGKSTLVDAITGFVSPRAGSIELDGRELRRLGATARARLGLARAFQSLELFEDMTVYENLLVAEDPGGIGPWLRDSFAPGRPRLGPVGSRAVRDLGLEDILGRLPGELSYGRRRLLAIARAIAADAGVLLLDEPAAGLDSAERANLARLIRGFAHERGLAVLLIEHDVNLVCDVSDRMLALDFGRVLVTGGPDAVRSDPRVRSAYLGIEPEEAPELADGAAIAGLDPEVAS